MSGPLDLIGQRFGKLLVQYRFGAGDHHERYVLWACWCDCGRTTLTRTVKLTHGQSSCGRWCGHTRTTPIRVPKEQAPVGLDLSNVWHDTRRAA